MTEATPESRPAELLDGVEEPTLVTAHSHVSYERRPLGRRLLNPGSGGRPYEGRHGACWGLGPSSAATPYDVDAVAERMRPSGESVEEELAQLLLKPLSRTEAVAHAESVVFSG